MFTFFDKKKFQLTIDDSPPILLEHKETVLNGAVRSNIDFPHSCKAGGCGACKCKLLSGKVKELTDKSYLLSKEEIANNFILGCQSIPKSHVEIALPVNTTRLSTIKGEITKQTPLTHDISEITLTLESPLHYLAGQYAELSPADSSLPARSYSFAHACPDSESEAGTKEISFFVRAVPNGKMSNWLLSENSLHATLLVKGTFGEFYLRESPKPMVCIAGGSGLAPLISILEEALNQQKKTLSHQRDVLLLLGARTQRDLYYQEQIDLIKSQWSGSFKFQAVLSDEPADSGWQGLRGFVTDHISKELATEAEGYFCGPPPMIDAAIKQMASYGVSSEHIFFDKFLDQHDALLTA